MQSLLAGRQRDADALIETWIASGVGYADIASYGIQPALYEVGELWADGRISVAQEHLATAIYQGLLVRAYDATEFAEPRDDKALFACVEHNLHTVGLRIVCDSFAIGGWDVEFLGADVATADLVRHVVAWRPHLLGLSISTAEHLETAQHAIAQIREALGDEAPKIVVGGRVLRELADGDPGLAANLFHTDASRVRELL